MAKTTKKPTGKETKETGPGLKSLKQGSEVNYVISQADVKAHPGITSVKIHRAFIKEINGKTAKLFIKQVGKAGEGDVDLGERKYSEQKEEGTFHCV